MSELNIVDRIFIMNEFEKQYLKHVNAYMISLKVVKKIRRIKKHKNKSSLN